MLGLKASQTVRDFGSAVDHARKKPEAVGPTGKRFAGRGMQKLLQYPCPSSLIVCVLGDDAVAACPSPSSFGALLLIAVERGAWVLASSLHADSFASPPSAFARREDQARRTDNTVLTLGADKDEQRCAPLLRQEAFFSPKPHPDSSPSSSRNPPLSKPPARWMTVEWI